MASELEQDTHAFLRSSTRWRSGCGPAAVPSARVLAALTAGDRKALLRQLGKTVDSPPPHEAAP